MVFGDMPYNRASNQLQICMELAYLLAARKSEVLDLMRFDLLAEGVRVRRGKGSKTNVVRWSPRLEAAMNRALALPGKSEYLINDKAGEKFLQTSFDSAWQRLKAGFRFHDLKAKGVSDSKAANPAGHKSVAMIESYRRKPDEVDSPA
jgi:integrase